MVALLQIVKKTLQHYKKFSCKKKQKDNTFFFYNNFQTVLRFVFLSNKFENATFLAASLIQLILQNLKDNVTLSRL